MPYRKFWMALAVVLVGSFAVLGYFGRQTYVTAPPLPERVVTRDGGVVFTGEEIRRGQNVWQSLGGQEVGAVWGHGAYVAPDWSADWLHREAVWLLEHWAQEEYSRPYDRLQPEEQVVLRTRLAREIRTTTYDPATGSIVVSPLRAQAIRAVAAHYEGLFGSDPGLAESSPAPPWPCWRWGPPSAPWRWCPWCSSASRRTKT